MDISDWLEKWLDPVAIATLLLAVATFILAKKAQMSIEQNNSFRKNDRRIAFLNETRTWANEGLSFVTRYRASTTNHEVFPPVWEAKARLSHLSSQPFIEDFSSNDFKGGLRKSSNKHYKMS